MTQPTGGRLEKDSSGWPRSAYRTSLPTMPLQALADHLQVGDLIFIRLRARPFTEAADVMMSWTNHVGVVISTHRKEPIVAESVVPMSRLTRLSRVISRSDYWRVAIKRLPEPLTGRQQARLLSAAQRRMGILYDGGFNLNSRRQFCSKFVREVMAEATGQKLGEIETLGDLFRNNPEARLGFWKVWYLGRIPWERETVTPVSLMLSPTLRTVFDGHVLMPHRDALEHRRAESGWSGISSLPTTG
jgi:hypothetical protein